MPAMTFSSKHGAARFVPILRVAGDAAARTSVALTKAVCLVGRRVGRRGGVHLPLDSSRVSKLHALIVKEKDRVYIRDLASRNRLFVNGQTVREVDLGTGDVVKVGPYNLHCASGFNEPEPTAAADAPRAPDAVLEVNAGAAHAPLVARAILIGSRDECDVVLPDDDAVSPVHAVLFELDGKRYLRDLGSAAGTLVNGEKIHQQALALGDEIRVGQTRLRYAAATDETLNYPGVDDPHGSGLAHALEDDPDSDVEVAPHELGLDTPDTPDTADDALDLEASRALGAYNQDESSGIPLLADDDEDAHALRAHASSGITPLGKHPEPDPAAPGDEHDLDFSNDADADDDDLATLEVDPDALTTIVEQPAARVARKPEPIPVEPHELGIRDDEDDHAPTPPDADACVQSDELLPVISGDRPVGVIDAAIQDASANPHESADSDLHDPPGGFTPLPLIPVGGPDSAVGGLPLPPAMAQAGYGDFDPEPDAAAHARAAKPLSPEETITPDAGDDELLGDPAVRAARAEDHKDPDDAFHEPAHPFLELVRQDEPKAAPRPFDAPSAAPAAKAKAEAETETEVVAGPPDEPDDLADFLKFDEPDPASDGRRSLVRKLDRVVHELSDRVAELKSTWKQVKQTRPKGHPRDRAAANEKPTAP